MISLSTDASDSKSDGQDAGAATAETSPQRARRRRRARGGGDNDDGAAPSEDAAPEPAAESKPSGFHVSGPVLAVAVLLLLLAGWLAGGAMIGLVVESETGVTLDGERLNTRVTQ